jgi:hypothetical protein
MSFKKFLTEAFDFSVAAAMTAHVLSAENSEFVEEGTWKALPKYVKKINPTCPGDAFKALCDNVQMLLVTEYKIKLDGSPGNVKDVTAIMDKAKELAQGIKKDLDYDPIIPLGKWFRSKGWDAIETLELVDQRSKKDLGTRDYMTYLSNIWVPLAKQKGVDVKKNPWK